ncbi:uncharacterized protein [Clytia hemisphaerica]|uniref:uncharacterized protein n=1 Tax=Clytia hemisphaerica TaxID=252671 RepID=UPI0034D4AD07|eukprot:TCONS_00069715-protein
MMDVSTVGSTLPNEQQQTINRKTKRIHYRKHKGKLVKSGGILNRSVYQLNLSKSLNDESILAAKSLSQLVPIQNINAFLSKNKALARALVDSRKQAKNFEKEKFIIQLECMEMKEKLNNLQNAALRCTCNDEEKLNNTNVDLLLNIKDNLTKNMAFIEKYIHNVSSNSLIHQCDDSKNHTVAVETCDVSVQANFGPPNIDSAKHSKKHMRNKKVQVDLSKGNLSSRSLENKSNNSDRSLEKSREEKSPSKRTISIQTNLKTKSTNSIAVQCALQPAREPAEKSGKPKERTPLKLLNGNGGNTPSSLTKSKSNISRMNNKKSPFEIYNDESNKENVVASNNVSMNACQIKKSKKSVTIRTEPTEVHYYEVLSPHIDTRLRPRNANTSYKEPSLNSKLQPDYLPTQLKVKKKRRRKRKPVNGSDSLENALDLVTLTLNELHL